MISEKNKALVRRLSADGMVLLKNDGTLPLNKNDKAAAFGRTMYFCFKGGAGSGDVMGREPVQPFDAMTADGFELEKSVSDFYISYNAERYEKELKYWNRVNRKWTNSFEEPVPENTIVENAAEICDIALISLGRSSGEWLDIPAEKGGFYLTDNEREMLRRVTSSFKKTVLLLNYCGTMDLSFIEEFDFNAVLYTAMGGEQMGNAVCDVLSGRVNPSAKLTDTWLKKLDDYPIHDGFDSLYIPYNEGIYVGYRYFDSFNVTPLFPFGYGLSYTDFEICDADALLSGSRVTLTATVKNTGNFDGREVVQAYISEPWGKLEKAYQQLAAFKKTAVIKKGESERVELSFDLKDFAAYNENTAEYVLEEGEYFVRLGNSSRNTHIVAAVTVDTDIVCEKLSNRLSLKKPISPISADPDKMYTYDGETDEKKSCKKLVLPNNSIATRVVEYPETPKELVKADDKLYTLDEVRDGKATMEQFVAQLSDTELANILNGVTGSVLPTEMHVGTMARKVQGAAGEIWSDGRYKIDPCVNADGPAGIRLGGFINNEGDIPTDTELSLKMTAFPSATTLANTWDTAVVEQFGRAVSEDMDTCDLQGWLAPGMNIHRSPLCGRNFEYYSEDPVISGVMAAATVRGVQLDKNGNPDGHYATIKHFAANNAESHRFDSDSAVPERALREIYLKGFKIAVEDSQPYAIMNSYNKVNGVYTSDSYDLNTAILRDEWGFDSCVMTDWGAKSSAEFMPNAGCDLVMPGCKNADYLKLLQNGVISRGAAQRCAGNVLCLVIRTSLAEKK